MAENNDQITYRIVLFQPEIPANTGNIGRLCLGANAELHLIKPMRFFINDKYLKRAGLDYWEHVKLFIHDSLDDMLKAYPENRVFYCTTKSNNSYTDHSYQRGDIFVFGPESRGLPEDLIYSHPQNCITIPMHSEIRSINLSNSVSIILYEAVRQINFKY